MLFYLFSLIKDFINILYKINFKKVFTFSYLYDIIQTKVGGTMWESIAEVFTTMQWYIILPLCLSIVLLLIECFVPGFGFFGISSLVCAAGGIIAHGILNVGVRALLLVLLFIIILSVFFLIFIRSARFGLISKTPLVENKTAVAKDYADKNTNDLKGLIGQRGVTTTPLRPSGKFMIDNNIYEGTTGGKMLEKGTIIKILDVEGVKIKVEKVEEV